MTTKDDDIKMIGEKLVFNPLIILLIKRLH